MFAQAYRYRFLSGVDLRRAGELLQVALLAAEGLFGAARVRMDGASVMDMSINVLAVDGSTGVGQAVNAIFASFLLHALGSERVDVRRVRWMDTLGEDEREEVNT